MYRKGRRPVLVVSFSSPLAYNFYEFLRDHPITWTFLSISLWLHVTVKLPEQIKSQKYSIFHVYSISFVNFSRNEAADPPIYNYHSSWTNSLTWGQYIDLAFKYGKRIPSSRSIWCYSLTAIKSYTLFYILSILLHTLPAIFLDVGLLIAGQKPR